MKQTNTQLLGALVRVLVGKEYYIGTVFSINKFEYLVEVTGKEGFIARITNNIYPIDIVQRQYPLPDWDSVLSGYDTLPYPGHWRGTTRNLHKEITTSVNKHILVHDRQFEYVLLSLSIDDDEIRYEWRPLDECDCRMDTDDALSFGHTNLCLRAVNTRTPEAAGNESPSAGISDCANMSVAFVVKGVLVYPGVEQSTYGRGYTPHFEDIY